MPIRQPVFVIVDLDSGTIIGSSAMIVDISNLSDDEVEELSSDQSAAIDYAVTHGTPVRLP